MIKSDSKLSGTLFTRAVIGLLFAASVVLTGCPNKTGETFRLGGPSIEGTVWGMVSLKKNEETPQAYPLTKPTKTEQPYWCFSGGKAYSANKITDASPSTGNGIFKLGTWDEPFTLKDGKLTIGANHSTFSINGNMATMTTKNGSDTFVFTLQRVASPSVEEIKAAR